MDKELEVTRARCGECNGEIFVIHTKTLSSRKWENPKCRHCGESWRGYHWLSGIVIGGCLVIWGEE